MTEPIGDAARHYAAGNLTAAARACLDLIARDPLHFDALHLLGVISVREARAADGIGYLLRAEAIQADDGRLQTNLGNAFGLALRYDRAVVHYRQALALNPTDAGTGNNLGLALRGLRREEDAIACFRAALAADPAHGPARFNLGRALAAIGDLAGAEGALRTVLTTLPSDAPPLQVVEAASELAHVIVSLGRPEEGLAILRGTKVAPEARDPLRWNESLTLLLLGRFQEGWAAYEARWKSPNHESAAQDYVVLNLDQVAGQRVLVEHEQGRGDIIQFLRYIRPLAERGARIRLSVYENLAPLALELPEVEQVVHQGDVVECDLRTSVMSLPLAFRTFLSTIPATVPYLRTPAARIARMRHHLGPSREPRIGLAWSGSSASYARSAMPAAALAPLLSRNDVRFHCLQTEINAADRAWIQENGRVATHEAMLRDFGDTAALIEAMDLVVSIDTAVAHLAGALARPVWIMLPFNPDWRWMLGREDSPWYPTARLFRQPAIGDWDSVARAVAAACELWVRSFVVDVNQK